MKEKSKKIVFKGLPHLSGNSHVLTIPKFLIKNEDINPLAECKISIIQEKGDGQ